MLKKLYSSPYLVRIVPFAAFVALTLIQGEFGDAGQYWIYTAKTLLGAWLLWLVRKHVAEMRWSFSWEAAAVGVAVFLAWVGLDGMYPMLMERSGSFNPVKSYGGGSPMALAFIAVRILGSTLVVPPLEEVFYRSFAYRWLVKPDFASVPLGAFRWWAFLVVGVVFGLNHFEWLPGILCAFAYQGLVCRKGRLGDAMAAHAITNLLLGAWVVWKDAWQFW
ncbi:MAG: CAAX prenyl protease-related protein [Acidobacteriota bacterium]|jgi:CAAX prenyl protease-like protein|nr:CAAX prenyl protease-related protein [Acidobacteriota bacterium]